MPLRRRGVRPCRVEQTSVSGIPCFWSPSPPPFVATLLFRVGRADETLPTSGLTHISEHLLMPAEPPRDLDRNARVEDLFAVFWATGNERRVLRFLEQTAALMRSPPLERLETERRILQTEAASRGQHAVTGASGIRYGAAAHGLSGYDEYGLQKVGAEAVGAWIGANFTRGNAALWMSGPPPKELELELPAGERRPPPEPAPLPEIEYPAVFPHGADATVVVSLEGSRGPSFSVAHAALVDRAWKRIRYEQGLAYDVGDWFEPLTGKLMSATYWIESLEENVGPVREALLEIVRTVADTGATDEEIEREVELFAEAISDPTEVPGFLHFSATERLLGEPFVELEEWLRRRREVTSESTAAALRTALDRMLLILPEDSDSPEGFSPIEWASPNRVEGKAHRPAGLPLPTKARKARLVVGDEGVSLVFPDGDAVTVRWNRLGAVLRWPDGSRTLLGSDGFRLHVDPEDWRNGKQVVEAIDRRSNEDDVIVMERELTSRMERVEEAAQACLKRRWVVEEELGALAEELGDDEQILALAEASRGLRAGLIVLTDRRVLWLYTMFGGRRVELAYDEIAAVAIRSKLGDRNLELETGSEKLVFGDIVPKERAADIEKIVTARIETPSRTSPAPE